MFDDFLAKTGIMHETTVPYSPQENGVAERLNRTVIERVRSVLQGASLGQRYLGEAVTTAMYLKNRSPTIAVKVLPLKRYSVGHKWV
jgi:transposase InsO family protein